ncbi:MAG: hypothetical protein Q4A19_05265 [Johnsonella sp.]|nr:hypothetical protein [Johnsonella sp.]
MKKNVRRMLSLILILTLGAQNSVYGNYANDTKRREQELILSEGTFYASPSDAGIKNRSLSREAEQESIVCCLDRGSIEIGEGQLQAYGPGGERIEAALDTETKIIVRQEAAQETANGILVRSGSARLSLQELHFRGENLIRMEASAHIDLELSGSSAATGESLERALIEVPSGASLHIGGDGELSLESAQEARGALIGGGAGEKSGTIEMESGRIKGIHHGYGACIGGGRGAGWEAIEILGGEVELEIEKVLSGACIGSGAGADGESGRICVRGGKLQLNGGWGASLIGMSVYGFKHEARGSILVSGGRLLLTPKMQSAAMKAREIEIEGGETEIKKGHDARSNAAESCSLERRL